ncbi:MULTISPECIES: hypothetical protein [Parabacteroides]|uniref:hypothetical protein n=1 Tax=Parabacteroides leei TaxID=2939491 RepID=UPI001899EE58|nr:MULTISPECIES: hypothetical protein [Parabacteroides]MCL3849791.1 hypothetical protein [Parabacteroides leei]
MKALLIICLLLITELSHANAVDYGLFIQAYPSERVDFSSLILEDGESIKLGKETNLSFNMYIREDNIFGLVFRILTDNNENIDLIFTPGDNNERYPMLVINESTHQLPLTTKCNTWIPVEISLNTETGNVRMLYGTTEISTPDALSKAKSARISFGISTFKDFEISEVASVNLRDIKIVRDKELIRYWKLKQHARTICYDSVNHIPAQVINPKWLIDNHVNWEKLYSGNIPENTLFAFNPQTSEFYIVPDSKEIQVFNTEKKTLSIIKVEGGSVAANAPNQLLYDEKRHLLLSYNIDEKTHSTFSFETNRWDHSDKPTMEHRYWNNTACYSPEDSSIISFGGYGFYKYTNELIKLKPYNNTIENTITLSDIDPRYSPASVIVGNTLYIFGGRGCKSGRQELYPHYYYDLYAVDLGTLKVQKIWEAQNVKVDFLPGENLFYDKDNDCFYVFAVKEKGALLKIDPKNKELEEITLPLGENMESHYVYTNLFYSPKNNKLFALINKTKADKTSSVSIYSISFPPLSVNSLYQGKKEGKSQLPAYIGYMIGLVILSTGVFFLSRQKRKQQTEPEKVSGTVMPVESVITEMSDQQEGLVIPQTEPQQPYYDFSKQSIRFLGRFCVKDKNGEDITDQFTPMLKQLFVLLILFTVKQENGISGSKLIQYLWSDKIEESAKNNRNVYLSKLRVLVDKVGGIEIISKNSFWTIRFSKDTVCDYAEAMRYLNEIMNEQSLSQKNLNKLLELLLRGTLLPNLETDWVDNFKSNFSSQTIDILTRLLNDKTYDFDNKFKLQIADTLFLHDYINEDALYTKCSILCNSGKRGLAKNIYDNFCKEYHNLLDTDYKYSLSDVINRGNTLL